MSSKNQKKYIIGIDAGASNTEVVIFCVIPAKAGIHMNYALSKKLHSEKFAPINYNILGKKQTTLHLVRIVKTVTNKIGLNNVSAVVAGIAGARRKIDRDNIRESLQKSLKVKNIKILPDTEIAFASVFDKNERNCGILIAGTGSILYYRDTNGKINRVGGWGRIIGDEGSGYWIGKEALNRLTEYYDGIGEKTKLRNVLKRKYKIDASSLVQKVYHEYFEISGIAKHVFDCAESGDKVSISIIKEAAEHFADHLSIFRKKKMTIALMGSLFSKEYLLVKYLRKLAKRSFPNIKLVKPTVRPVWGAVKIASGKD